jgi:hypothetical protein
VAPNPSSQVPYPGVSPTISGPITAALSPLVDLTGPAEAANLAASENILKGLIDQIKTIDPSYRHDSLQPFEAMSWQARNDTIDGVRFDRAAALYRFRGKERELQVETVRFLQGRVDAAYDRGVKLYNAGRLKPSANRETTIGSYVDKEVRQDLRAAYNQRGLDYGGGKRITINNRQYANDGSYAIPDVQIGRIAIDWTLTPKTSATPQVQGFFNAASQPRGVIIIRPTQLSGPSLYAIPRLPLPPSVVTQPGR